MMKKMEKLARPAFLYKTILQVFADAEGESNFLLLRVLLLLSVYKANAA